MTTSHPDAAALAAEAQRLMLAFAEQVWQAGTEGFNCATVAPCRAARAQAEAAIDRLAALAQRPESTSERAQARDGFTVMPNGTKPQYRLHLQIDGAIWRYVQEDMRAQGAAE
jgi:hypothetical protein